MSESKGKIPSLDAIAKTNNKVDINAVREASELIGKIRDAGFEAPEYRIDSSYEANLLRESDDPCL